MINHRLTISQTVVIGSNGTKNAISPTASAMAGKSSCRKASSRKTDKLYLA